MILSVTLTGQEYLEEQFENGQSSSLGCSWLTLATPNNHVWQPHNMLAFQRLVFESALA